MKKNSKAQGIIFVIVGICLVIASLAYMVANKDILFSSKLPSLNEVFENGEEPVPNKYYEYTINAQLGNYAEMQHKKNGTTTSKDQYYIGVLNDADGYKYTLFSFEISNKKDISAVNAMEDATVKYFKGQSADLNTTPITIQGKWEKLSNSELKGYFLDRIDGAEEVGFDSISDYQFNGKKTKSAAWGTFILLAVFGVGFVLVGFFSYVNAKKFDQKINEVYSNPYQAADNSYANDFASDYNTNANQNPYTDNNQNF